MARSAFIAVLCSLVASSLACTCLAPPPFRQAITEAKDSDSPYAVATIISEDRPADINGLVTYTLRTDGCPSTVIATTCGNGACCGTVLKVNTKYVIRLKKNGARSSVSLCGVQREYNSISSADRAFVDANVTGRCVASSCAAVTCVDGDICVDGKCAKQIPFKPSLIGTKYEVFRGSCGFLRGNSMKVTIEETRLKYVPSVKNDPRGGYGGAIHCSGFIELYYRHRPYHLWIRAVNETRSSYPPGGRPKPCSSLQTIKYISPWGPSRDEFIVEFKALFAGVQKINSATPDCVKSGGKPDAVLSYLYMVAYEYFITL